MFLAAEKLHAEEALRFGLIDAVADDPLTAAIAPDLEKHFIKTPPRAIS